ncbi:MAG: hypothetical protein FJX52_12000, partial [Alphaproteobacteria bacterium]|nr:hypothetical protein [Alphaproteobacteria bacterium]
DLLDAPPAKPGAVARVEPAKPASPGRADLRRTPGLDKASATRLRRSQFPIDRRIDLHGLTRAEAHARVISALATNSRCLLIITGKGQRRGSDSGGVLRGELPRWLAEPPHRERILAVMPAQPAHGGGGAVYVLLRRRRPAG